ncbi:Archaemetzincin-2 [Trichoderma ghanense]|uniref:Archaemetzincin-2 n=1 Tax=Trichoderma ghanense TaxID=65468 RepID=A0ABY2H220_9HYPO
MEWLFGRQFATPEDARAAIGAAAQQAGYSFTQAPPPAKQRRIPLQQGAKLQSFKQTRCVLLGSMKQACQHSHVYLDGSPHASKVGFKSATERQRLLAATKDGRVGKTAELLTAREAFGDGMIFPGPLVLPDDDLAEDPEYPPQDLKEWRDEEERNPVTPERKTIYIVPSPSIAPEVSKMHTWSACSNQPSTAKHDMQAAEPPKIQDLIEYLSAFFHGMAVKHFKPPFQWQKWNKYDGTILKSPSTHRRIGLTTPGHRLFGIRCRASPDGVSPMQINLDDVLDALAENIPADAHSIMMLLDLDMYEGDGDVFTAGRAYGGSRIAAVSLFRDQPLCAPPDDSHAWPASHCAEYIDQLCLEASCQPPTKKKAKLQPSSRRSRTGTSGPLDKAIEAVQAAAAAAAAEASSSVIPRPERPDAAAATAQWLGRTAVTMAHELCHCLGLDHCTYFACAMQGCGSVDEAQRQPPYVCPVCLEKICRAIGEGVVDGWEGDRAVREGFVRERYVKLRGVCERWSARMFVGYRAWLDAVLEDCRAC